MLMTKGSFAITKELAAQDPLKVREPSGKKPEAVHRLVSGGFPWQYLVCRKHNRWYTTIMINSDRLGCPACEREWDAIKERYREAVEGAMWPDPAELMGDE